ncbi:hypothetical protein ACLOJK_034586 [Asimina triloba]
MTSTLFITFNYGAELVPEVQGFRSREKGAGRRCRQKRKRGVLIERDRCGKMMAIALERERERWQRGVSIERDGCGKMTTTKGRQRWERWVSIVSDRCRKMMTIEGRDGFQLRVIMALATGKIDVGY